MLRRDFTKELAKLDSEHDAIRGKLMIENELYAALPDAAKDYRHRFHVRSLYGVIASVNFTHDFYRYDDNDDDSTGYQPDLNLCLILAGALQDVPRVMVRDGCLSFRTAAHVALLPEQDKARWSQELPVCPWLMHFNQTAHYQPSIEIEWTALLGGRPVEIAVTLPVQPALGTYSVDWSKHMGGERVRAVRCSIPEHLHDIQDATGETLANAEPSIKWASGSEAAPNRYTYYWVNARADRLATTLDFARTIARMPLTSPPAQPTLA